MVTPGTHHSLGSKVTCDHCVPLIKSMMFAALAASCFHHQHVSVVREEHGAYIPYWPRCAT